MLNIKQIRQMVDKAASAKKKRRGKLFQRIGSGCLSEKGFLGACPVIARFHGIEFEVEEDRINMFALESPTKTFG
jgi:hypothetical protein